MHLENLAMSVAASLGRGFHMRSSYRFAVPTDGHVRERVADAVVFSSPIASSQTAMVGFAAIESAASDASDFSDFAYLGAPILVATSPHSTSLYAYRGSPRAEKLDQVSLPPSASAKWVRERLTSAPETHQLSFPIGAGRELLLAETRSILADRVRELMLLARQRANLDELQAFSAAIAVIRRLCDLEDTENLVTPAVRVVVHELASEFEQTVSFANVPPESLAELYESLAVGLEARRRRGVVYTPAWLARYVIARLPSEAFFEGRAVDPACGSGTFLVCFLERLAEEHSRRGKAVETGAFGTSVRGIDLDPVAIEAARLSLDLFARGFPGQPPQWDLAVADSTSTPVAGEWVTGNLPFGYRTHIGVKDISAEILENVVRSNSVLKGISLILPDSLAYTKSAASARRLLRTRFRIQEITRLPETVFPTSAAKTIVLAARIGEAPGEVVVREVTTRDLSAFKTGRYVAPSFGSRFPDAPADPWRFTPFSNEFDIAEKTGVALRTLATVRLGLQVYGAEETVISNCASTGERPLLLDSAIFARWRPSMVKSLPLLVGTKEEVRRPGPWTRFPQPKVIIRTTTSPGNLDRLAAIPDEQGIWFGDKFTGIWLIDTHLDPDICSLAAYLQTRFARMWFDTNNPSRKLRIATFSKLPIPKLPPEWWQRAKRLAPLNQVVRPIDAEVPQSTLFQSDGSVAEWEWFNSAVETALGVGPSSGAMMQEWLLDRDRQQRHR